MKTDNIAALLIEGCKTVAVKFPYGHDSHEHNYTRRSYIYKTMDDLAVDDIVVVQVKRDFKTAIVVEVHDIPQIDVSSSGIKLKWIVQKVDTTQYKKLLAVEKEFKDQLLRLEQEKVKTSAKQMLVETYGENAKMLESIVESANSSLQLHETCGTEGNKT